MLAEEQASTVSSANNRTIQYRVCVCGGGGGGAGARTVPWGIPAFITLGDNIDEPTKTYCFFLTNSSISNSMIFQLFHSALI